MQVQQSFYNSLHSKGLQNTALSTYGMALA